MCSNACCIDGAPVGSTPISLVLGEYCLKTVDSPAAEIEERALLFGGLKHYFIVRFPQRAGALKEFVVDILGDRDNISFFEYSKKTNREKGSAVVGIELEQKEDLEPLIQRMKAQKFFEEYLNDKPSLFEFLV